MESAGWSADLASQQLVEGLKDKYRQATLAAEAKVRVEQEAVALLSQKLRAAESLAADLTEEKTLLMRALEDGRSQLRLLEEVQSRF